MKKNLLLDLDGVHYDLSYIEEPSILTAALNAAKILNLPSEEVQTLIEASKIFDNFELYRPFEELANGDDYKTNIFNQEIVNITDYSAIPSNQELFVIIKELEKQYEVIVITDNSKPHTEKVFNALWNKGIDESNIDVYSIEDAKQGKLFLSKKEGGLELFCLRRGIKPSECLLIDDSKTNIEVANKLGMQTILFDESQNINELLKKIGSQ